MQTFIWEATFAPTPTHFWRFCCKHSYLAEFDPCVTQRFPLGHAEFSTGSPNDFHWVAQASALLSYKHQRALSDQQRVATNRCKGRLPAGLSGAETGFWFAHKGSAEPIRLGENDGLRVSITHLPTYPFTHSTHSVVKDPFPTIGRLLGGVFFGCSAIARN